MELLLFHRLNFIVMETQTNQLSELVIRLPLLLLSYGTRLLSAKLNI